MSVIFLLLVLSICVAGTFLIGFLWSVRSGQYDDQAAPPVRMLFDDTVPSLEKKSTEKKNRSEACK